MGVLRVKRRRFVSALVPLGCGFLLVYVGLWGYDIRLANVVAGVMLLTLALFVVPAE